MIRVGIVDDHAIVRVGLRNFLAEQVDVRVVGEAANGREAIDLARTTEMDVMLMDLSMPGQGGIDALAMIRADGLPHELLSEREFQVFLKLAAGQTAGQVAEELSLSVKTVSTYRTRLMEKLGLHSNSDLTYYALTNKLIT